MRQEAALHLAMKQGMRHSTCSRLHAPRTLRSGELTHVGTRRKVAELEREMRRLLTHRTKYASGRECCCCTILFHNAVIPNYVRVWDM